MAALVDVSCVLTGGSQNVARTGGLIFDSCWRADNTVKGSETSIGNPRMQINIAGQGP